MVLVTLKALGERKIIEFLLEQFEKMPNMAIPFGDDVAAYPAGDKKLFILKTDMLVGKTDVPPGMNLWQAARKAVVMNVSDFAAKGVKPKAILVSLGLPDRLTKKDIVEIGAGLNSGAREYDTYILGGDTGEASDLIISLSVFGTAEKRKVMFRSGAKPGDLVAVSGCFGKTLSGLKILLGNLEAPKKVREVLVDSVLMPKARLEEGLALNETGAISAAIDSSDGLAWSLHEISRASGVGILVEELPTAKEVLKFAKTNGLDPTELTLYGGEEYELVLTIKPKLWQKALEASRGELLLIGKVTAEKEVVLEFRGKRRVVEPRGYEHFASEKCLSQR
jgi:thiamine-monophosphate kinase